MAVNLSRNTKAYFTTYNVDPAAAGFVAPSAEVPGSYTTSNTWEITILDGYSFSQGTEQQTITLSEAGTTPVRGERSFSSKLNPVDWSLSTYIRPYKSGTVSAPEKVLWNALLGSDAIDTVGTAFDAGAKVDATTGTITITAGNIYGGSDVTAERDKAIGATIRLTGVTPVAYNGDWTITGVSESGGDYTYTFDTDGVDLTGAVTVTGTAYTGQWHESSSDALVTTLGSNRNNLQKFALLFKVDNSWYKVYNTAVNQANISFDLAGIAMVEWSGFGTELHQLTNAAMTPTAFTSGVNFTAVNAAATKYITNKLSTTTLEADISGGGTAYSVPITGGNLTINNNIEYVTPENLGVINRSIGYFTGTRSITGSLNAYLKTGSNESGDLLKDILTGLATTSETKFMLQIEIGGINSTTKVEVLMNGCQLQVPSVDIQDVVSTTINFTAQGYTGTDYDIAKTNNLRVTYVGV